MADKIYKYSSSPHVKANNTTRRIMIDVCIALLPAVIMGIVYFGLNAFLIIACALISAVASEFIYLLIAGKSIKEIANGKEAKNEIYGCREIAIFKDGVTL